MNEYSDQAVWFELWGYDGFQWEFLADFDSRSAAEVHVSQSDYTDDYERTRIKRVRGQM